MVYKNVYSHLEKFNWLGDTKKNCKGNFFIVVKSILPEIYRLYNSKFYQAAITLCDKLDNFIKQYSAFILQNINDEDEGFLVNAKLRVYLIKGHALMRTSKLQAAIRVLKIAISIADKCELNKLGQELLIEGLNMLMISGLNMEIIKTIIEHKNVVAFIENYPGEIYIKRVVAEYQQKVNGQHDEVAFVLGQVVSLGSITQRLKGLRHSAIKLYQEGKYDEALKIINEQYSSIEQNPLNITNYWLVFNAQMLSIAASCLREKAFFEPKYKEKMQLVTEAINKCQQALKLISKCEQGGQSEKNTSQQYKKPQERIKVKLSGLECIKEVFILHYDSVALFKSKEYTAAIQKLNQALNIKLDENNENIIIRTILYSIRASCYRDYAGTQEPSDQKYLQNVEKGLDSCKQGLMFANKYRLPSKKKGKFILLNKNLNKKLRELTQMHNKYVPENKAKFGP
jgi:tetratricopeptide (TPR) repeat protein